MIMRRCFPNGPYQQKLLNLDHCKHVTLVETNMDCMRWVVGEMIIS